MTGRVVAGGEGVVSGEWCCRPRRYSHKDSKMKILREFFISLAQQISNYSAKYKKIK
jgi:hypothetical protein